MSFRLGLKYETLRTIETGSRPSQMRKYHFWVIILNLDRFLLKISDISVFPKLI
jgi:hypothetical protein